MTHSAGCGASGSERHSGTRKDWLLLPPDIAAATAAAHLPHLAARVLHVAPHPRQRRLHLRLHRQHLLLLAHHVCDPLLQPGLDLLHLGPQLLKPCGTAAAARDSGSGSWARLSRRVEHGACA